jgi:mRNA-degrading endonuclease RelE of RelBE toxin-antitoxin system
VVTVTITDEAQRQFSELPLPMQRRMRDVFLRLGNWPNVSGAKPLRKELAGNFRIRTGDYRVIFKVSGNRVIVWKIGYRGGIYE